MLKPCLVYQVDSYAFSVLATSNQTFSIWNPTKRYAKYENRVAALFSQPPDKCLYLLLASFGPQIIHYFRFTDNITLLNHRPRMKVWSITPNSLWRMAFFIMIDCHKPFL